MKTLLMLLLISFTIIGSATATHGNLSLNQVEANEIVLIDVLDLETTNKINISVDENNLIQFGLAYNPYQCNHGRICTSNRVCGPGGECTIQSTTGYRRCVCR